MKKFSRLFSRLIIICLLPVGLLLWAGCNMAAPSGEESPAIDLPSPTALPEPERIEISEYMAKNRASLPDENGVFSDWLEITNPGEEGLLLQGWSISDGEGASRLPLPDIFLPAGGRQLVFASGREGQGVQLHVDFALSEGEGIYLWDQYGRLIDSVGDICAESDRAYVRCEDGSFVPSDFASPGYPNDAEGYALWQQSRSCSSPIIINEIMNANSAFISHEGWEYPDWVEIKNISGETVELAEYYLSDSREDMLMWQFPQMLLAPGERVLVVCSDKELGHQTGFLYADFSLSAQGDQLYLSRSDRLMDYAAFGHIPLNCSLGRTEGSFGFYYFSSPSPGRENPASGALCISERPRSLTKDGVYEGADSVTVQLQAKGDIYYTTDGSMPNESSAKYTEALELKSTCVLRAISIEEGMLASSALSLSFIINEGHSMPVLSLLTDSPSAFSSMRRLARKDFEIPGSISLYEEDGSFTIDCGIRLSGTTSLKLPKKSMTLSFRPRYGQAVLEYDVFDGGVRSFTALSLRAGQDHYSALIRNELCQELCLQACDAVLTQRSKFCVLYANGAYMGIYVLKDRINEQFYASAAGVSEESVTMLNGPVNYKQDFYNDVWAFCVYGDMRLSENYEELCRRLDVDSLIDWAIMEGVCANYDLLAGNIRYCRSDENDGRWRLVFYDLDCAFYHSELIFYNLLSEYAMQQQVSQMLDALLDNQEFRLRFLQRFSAAVNGPLSNENMLAQIDRLEQTVEPEAERNASMGGLSYEKWQKNLAHIRNMIIAEDWQQQSIDNICSILRLTEAERLEFFTQ